MSIIQLFDKSSGKLSSCKKQYVRIKFTTQALIRTLCLLFLLCFVNLSISQTVQQRLDANESPKEIFDSGFPLDSIYGKLYKGGLIFYLDTIIGNGFVCAPNDQSAGATWGCSGTSIDGTSSVLYAGYSNTNAIVAGCSTPGIAAKLCYDLVISSNSDWYLPSRSELLLMISNLSSLGVGDFTGLFWSSTQTGQNNAYTNHASVAQQKSNSYKVRAISCFCTPNTCPCQVGTIPTHDLVQWEIFYNKMAPDFGTLRNAELIPSQKVNLDSLNVTDYLSYLDYFSSRIRGYLIPPISGIYSFYFACDDKGEFWLSADTTAANAELKSQIDSIQPDWSQNISTQTLVAGQKYYFEILQYDSVYTNISKLGWILPGESSPVTITSSNMAGYYDNIDVDSLKFVNDSMLVYPNWNISPQYHVTPWNAEYKTVNWYSSNNSVATVSVNGVVSTISPGTCEIIAISALNTSLIDTLYLTVSDYYGPFFVKQSANTDGDGHSWNDAIQLTKLLDILNQGLLTQQINVYVAEGVYTPTATYDRNKTFLMNNIRLIGGFDSTVIDLDTLNNDYVNFETILSGDIGIPEETLDNSYHVVKTMGEVTIEGITIRDGRANCRMYGDLNLYQFDENQGGGLYLTADKTTIVNCKISNNSAFNSGGGFYASFCDTIILQNCIISDNLIQQNVPAGGGMVYIVVNGYGPAFYFHNGTIKMGNCQVYGNNTPNLHPVCRFSSSTANVDNCSFYNNSGTADIGLWGTTSLNLNNSTVRGNLLLNYDPTAIIRNSTIVGSAPVIHGGVISILVDNSIWTGLTLDSLQNINLDPLNSFDARFSLIGNSLVGYNAESLIMTDVPIYTSWLDTLAYNGGLTPTMKLKNVSFNPAKSFGNSQYLDSLDQRGYLRKDSVSIGAYQWIRPDSVAFVPSQISLCQGDSVSIQVAVFPSYADNPSYTIVGMNNTIAIIDSLNLHAVSGGHAQFALNTIESNVSDTLSVEITGMVGLGSISGENIVCQGDGPLSYLVSPLINATDYYWTLPNGASGISNSSLIDVEYSLSASSGNILVFGRNSCFDGPIASFEVVVNDKPTAPVISQNLNVLSSNYSNWNQWYDQNGLIDDATNQNFVVINNGDYYAMVTLDGCSSEISNIISVYNVGKETLASNNFVVYPNPISDQLNIEMPGNKCPIYFEIHNVLGQTIYSGYFVEKAIINTSDFAPGVYLIKFENDKLFEFKKIIKD